MEFIQSRAMRCFLRVHEYTAKCAVIEDMGWDSCLIKQRCEIVLLWSQLVRLPEVRLTKKLFNWDQSYLCSKYFLLQICTLFL